MDDTSANSVGLKPSEVSYEAYADGGKSRASSIVHGTIPTLLGGSTSGVYADGLGRSFDGSSYTVVDIDGAFDTAIPSVASKVVAEACFGQLAGSQYPSLCNTSATEVRTDGSGGTYHFTAATGSSNASPATQNLCSQSGGAGMSYLCHYFHGAITSSAAVGKFLTSGNGTAYTGAAPGAHLITLKVGGGTGTSDLAGLPITSGATLGWPGASVVDALNYVNTVLASRTDLGRIAAVDLSVHGGRKLESTACPSGTDTIAAQINVVAGLLKAKGIAVVMAAGNDAITGSGVWNCGSNIIRVGASGVAKPTEPTAYTNISTTTSLYAPVGVGGTDGECVASRDCILVGSFGARLAAPQGTSFAAPQVAGAFAVLRQKFGMSRSVDSLVDHLTSSGTPLAVVHTR